MTPASNLQNLFLFASPSTWSSLVCCNCKTSLIFDNLSSAAVIVVTTNSIDYRSSYHLTTLKTSKGDRKSSPPASSIFMGSCDEYVTKEYEGSFKDVLKLEIKFNVHMENSYFKKDDITVLN